MMIDEGLTKPRGGMHAANVAVRKALTMEAGAAAYLEWANNGPPLHFAHANGFNAQTYASLLAPLANHFHIYASDLRGHGRSTLPTPPGFTRGWTLLRDDLIAFLGAMHAGPVFLAGHSVGAVLSLMTAAARPDLVRALFLVEPVFVPAGTIIPLAGNSLAERAAKRRSVFDSITAMEDAYRGRGAFNGWPDVMLHDYILGGTLPKEDGKIQLSCAPTTEAEAFANTPVGASALAAKITCPVTLIHGASSGSTCSAAEAAIFVQGKPDTRVVAVPEADHFLPMHYPQLVRDEILRLCARSGI